MAKNAKFDTSFNFGANTAKPKKSGGKKRPKMSGGKKRGGPYAAFGGGS
jgi:hypothetical protein